MSKYSTFTLAGKEYKTAPQCICRLAAGLHLLSWTLKGSKNEGQSTYLLTEGQNGRKMICSMQEMSYLWHLLSSSLLNSDEEMANATWQFQVGNFCINLWPNLKCDLNVLAFGSLDSELFQALYKLKIWQEPQGSSCNKPYFFHFGSDRRDLMGVPPHHMSLH